MAAPEASSFIPAKTIDDVISRLDTIIEETKITRSPSGYFAALYRKVTIKVKEGINDKFFENGARMERLDVVFANRYLQAYHDWNQKEEVTDSWKRSFKLSSKYWPIVLQHLLMGMNAHINLDLGIAAAEVSKNEDINKLKTDFDNINEVLASLVDEVQQDLANIWPTLHLLLKIVGRIDNLLTDFSMKLARDGAWRFATQIAGKQATQLEEAIQLRDQKVAKKGNIITGPGAALKIIVAIIRIGERGNVTKRIVELEN